MTTFDLFMKRNKDIAAENGPMPSLPNALPHVKALIIGCADMRVDPVYILGIEPGEAVVMRNIGGRITPRTLEQLGLLGRISQVAEAFPGGGDALHVIILHHTDCGITRLAGDPDMLANYFEISNEELEAKAVTDPRASVAADVAVLKAASVLPGEWMVSGLVYNVATGLIDIVVPPAPIHTPRAIS